MTTPTSVRKGFPVAAVLLILLAALALRSQALWLPHWRGDQAQYIILAMKLSNAGLNGYNLRAVSMGHLDVSPSKETRVEFQVVKPAEGNVDGAYLALMKSIGQAYYDEPLHVRAPLFPAILALSHRIFAGQAAPGEITASPPFAVLSYGPRSPAQAVETWRIWRHQLWAALVPLVFNLALIAMSAFLSWVLFASRRITVLAAAILAVNPISIWLAHKVLTEDAATFCVTTAVTLMALFWKRNRVAAGLAAGVLAGVAVLVNQRTGLLLPALGGFAALCLWQDAVVRRGSSRAEAFVSKCLQVVLDPFIWLMAASFMAVTGFWFWKVIQTYGHPLYQPGQAMIASIDSDVTGWFAAVHSRPHPSILFSIGVVALCPLLGFALQTWGRATASITGRFRDPASRSIALLWIWPAVFFIYMANLNELFRSGFQEHRYFYAAYPALTILAAFGLDRFISGLQSRRFLQNRLAGGIMIALVALLASAWGVWLAYPKILSDQMLF